MTDAKPIKGGCLCGAVRYEAGGPPKLSLSCYCIDCQKESGAGHLTFVAVPGDKLKVTGPTAVFTKPADGGLPLHRTFCTQCGSTITGRPETLGGLVMIRAGTLDDPSIAAPRANIYVSRAHAWDHVDDGLPGHAEMPPPRK